MKLYLLYFDTNVGSREEWNTFYTPCEVFDSEKAREERIEFIKNQFNQDGKPTRYEFHKADTVLMDDKSLKEWKN